MSQYLDIHHVSFLVRDTTISMRFYRDVLGMSETARMDLPFPGAWLAIGAQQIHLIELPNPDPVEGRPAHGGRDRHCAFTVRDIDWLTARLQEHRVAFTLSRSGRRALFCRDPDGNALEFIQPD